MDKPLSKTARVLLFVIMATMGALAVEYMAPSIDFHDLGSVSVLVGLLFVVVGCFALGRISQLYWLRNNRRSLPHMDRPVLFRAVLGEWPYLQAEMDYVFFSSVAGVVALLLGLFMHHAISMGAMIIVAWCAGCYRAIWEFIRVRCDG